MATTASGHRRISSLKNTTLNFLKGNRSSASSNGNPRRVKTPHSVAEEDLSLADARCGTEPISEKASSHRSRRLSPPGSLRPRPASLSAVDTPPGPFTDDMTGLSDMDSLPSPTGLRMATDDEIRVAGSSESTQTHPKKGSARFKLALNLFRRRSNSNLHKPFEISVPERHEGLDQDDPLGRSSFDQSRGFHKRWEFPTHGRPTSRRSPPRNILTKPLPHDMRRPRRATVASVVESTLDSAHTQWPGDPRPWSRLSNSPPDVDDAPATASLFSRQSTCMGGNMSGGLCPRPASMHRPANEAPKYHRRSISNSTARLAQHSPLLSSPLKPNVGVDHDREIQRTQPSSYAGELPSNGYGNMKITEAASLDSRVRELEDQVAVLQKAIGQQQTDLSPITPCFPVPDLQKQQLQPPFDDRRAGGRSYTMRSANAYFSSSPSRSPTAEEFPSADPARRYDDALHNLESQDMAETKRDTGSTMRSPRIGSKATDDAETPTVSLAEYTGLVAVVKREQRARRKLEAQVAHLQEQMATVLHRHLLAQPSPTRTGFTGLNSLQRKASSEIPTPDKTPPRLGSSLPHNNLFMGFESETDIAEHLDERGSILMGGADEEAWETPVEERGHSLDGFRRPSFCHTRTMSLGKVTHKSSK